MSYADFRISQNEDHLVSNVMSRHCGKSVSGGRNAWGGDDSSERGVTFPSRALTVKVEVHSQGQMDQIFLEAGISHNYHYLN